MKTLGTITALILHAVSAALSDIAVRYDRERLYNMGGALEEFSDGLYWRFNTRCLADYAENGA
jgi:hypothetical protein